MFPTTGDAAGVRDLTAVEAAMGTLAADRGLIFAGAVVAVVLAAIWSFLLKHFARLLVWATVGIAEVWRGQGDMGGGQWGWFFFVALSVTCSFPSYAVNTVAM